MRGVMERVGGYFRFQNADFQFLAEVSALWLESTKYQFFSRIACCEWCVGCADDIADDMQMACGRHRSSAMLSAERFGEISGRKLCTDDICHLHVIRIPSAMSSAHPRHPIQQAIQSKMSSTQAGHLCIKLSTGFLVLMCISFLPTVLESVYSILQKMPGSSFSGIYEVEKGAKDRT